MDVERALALLKNHKSSSVTLMTEVLKRFESQISSVVNFFGSGIGNKFLEPCFSIANFSSPPSLTSARFS
jgi:hypothetical protein